MIVTEEERVALPRGWVWTRLGETSRSIETINPKDRPDMEFTYVDISSIDNRIQKITEPKKFAGKDAPSRARQLIKKNDILFSTVRTYLKNISLVDEIHDGQLASTGFCVIRAHESINNNYIFLLTQMNSFLNPLTELQRGTSYPAVRDSDVFDQIIPLPPLREQHRIVAKIEELFTKLDAGVEALKKVKSQIRRYRQAVLKYTFEGKLTEEWRKAHKDELEPASVLLGRIEEEKKKKMHPKAKELLPIDSSDLPKLPEGWVWTMLSSIAEVRLGRQRSPSKVTGRYPKPYLRAANVRWGELDLSDVKEMDFDPSEFPIYELHIGDLLLVEASGSAEEVAKPAIWRGEIRDCCFQNTLIRVRPILMPSEFLYYHFLSDALAGRFGHEARGVGIHHLGAARTETWEITLPSVAEQLQIVSEIERRFSIADEVEKIVDQSLKQAERLRQSILKSAFEGRLVPQDPNDEPAEKLLERIRQERECSKTNKSSNRKKAK